MKWGITDSLTEAHSPSLQTFTSTYRTGPTGTQEFTEWLAVYHGKRIGPPQSRAYYPEPIFMAWHVREVFQGEARYSRSVTRRRSAMQRKWWETTKIEQLEIMLQEGEGTMLEYKESLSASFARELVALANTLGGRILLWNRGHSRLLTLLIGACRIRDLKGVPKPTERLLAFCMASGS